jgi:hypothetical protein
MRMKQQIRRASSHSATTENRSGATEKIRRRGTSRKPASETSMETVAKNPFVTFCEWAGETDEKAYADM